MRPWIPALGLLTSLWPWIGFRTSDKSPSPSLCLNSRTSLLEAREMAWLRGSTLCVLTVYFFVVFSAEATQLHPAESEAVLWILQQFHPDVCWSTQSGEVDLCSSAPSDQYDIGCDYKDDDGLNHITKLRFSCGSDYDPEPPTHSNSSHYSYIFGSFKFLRNISIDNCLAGTRLLPTFSSTIEELEFNNNPALAVPLSDIKFNYTELKRLVLTGNGLYGEIPDGFGKDLVHLQELTLSGNNLSGKVPSSLAELKNLRVLDLSDNNFEGSVPIEFGLLANNCEINIQNNNLSGRVPFCAKNVEKLQLGGNPDLCANEGSGCGLGNLKACSKAVLPNAILVSRGSKPLLVAPCVLLFLAFLVVSDLWLLGTGTLM